MGRKPKPESAGPEALTPQSFQTRYEQYDRLKIVWLDTRPDLPLSPGPGVMRWDLRPGDWLNHWPELLFHPCAYFHAPNHPFREGQPSALEMVRTLPVGFDWRASVPKDLHESIQAAFNELEQHPENAGPVGAVLIDSGILYSVDTVGRPFAVGKVVVNGDVHAVEPAYLPAPAPRSADQKNVQRSAEDIINELSGLLDKAGGGDSIQLADLLSVLVRAPDSANTKRKIVQILEQQSN